LEATRSEIAVEGGDLCIDRRIDPVTEFNEKAAIGDRNETRIHQLFRNG
jgi:hypothetical protein